LRQAKRLVIPGAVLQNLIPSEDVPTDYIPKMIYSQMIALNQPTSPAVKADFSFSYCVKVVAQI